MKLNSIFLALLMAMPSGASAMEGWRANYGGVMLQAFYWDSYSETAWTNLASQADELSQYFSLVWIPQSGKAGSAPSMGYDDKYWFPVSDCYTSSFGTEAELRNMITTFKNKGIGTIADVVINHRSNVSNWVDFPTEMYKGTLYHLTSKDICANDDGGKCKTANPDVVFGANDTGDDFDGIRDLDHTSANVQKNVKAYLHMLLEDLGYAGFRYDMVKGYAPAYTKLYNEDANPAFSVGEYWDNVTKIKTWVANTGKTSAAFDFPQKYLMNNNIANLANWYSQTATLNNDAAYKQYSVTFVDNHDTYRDNNRYTGNVPMANAWILANPGTPCVFLPHWNKYKEQIKAMIDARKAVGVSNTSTTTVKASAAKYLVAETTGAGSDKSLIVIIGNVEAGENAYNPLSHGYTRVVVGNKYAYYVKGVSGMAEQNFVVDYPKATIYVNCDSWAPNLYFYTWDKYNDQLDGTWPGTLITDTKQVGGKTWYYNSYDIIETGYTFNFIFNNGNGHPQTIDIKNLDSDRYFILGSLNTANKYNYEDVTANYVSGINSIKADNRNDGNTADKYADRIYTLQGALMSTTAISSLPKGVYIRNGKKFVIR